MSTQNGDVAAWPPRGWKQLDDITQVHGQALAKNVQTAQIYGLEYMIESEPLYNLAPHFFRHKIQFSGWHYSILNESSEYPVLSYTLTDRYDVRKPREFFISDIRVLSCPVETRATHIQNLLAATVLLAAQIQAGQVPDFERIFSVNDLQCRRARPRGVLTGTEGPRAKDWKSA